MVDAARWWGPFGWLYRNTPGNLVASAIAFVCAGVWVHVKLVLPAREHRKHVHERMDRIEKAVSK